MGTQTAEVFVGEPLSTSVDRTRLEREFSGNDAERRFAARQARDLLDSGQFASDRGHGLTVDECGNIYTVNIHSEGEVVPIGVPTCRGCGGSEFTIFGEHEETLIQTDEWSH